ncbi:SusC/RagA family TonB-linked outer membrane protein [Flavitalea flava]
MKKRLLCKACKAFLTIPGQIFPALFLFISFTASAQTMISGKVTSGDSALTGATIKVKGAATAVQTDNYGHFQINAPANGVLIISSIGYTTREVGVNHRSAISIQLENAVSSLNDVVVVGYGIQRKSDVTGSVVSVKTKDIEKTPANRIDDALQGRVSGLVVQHNDAAPNSTITIRIRGVNSINGGNDPLIVIDGLQGGNLNTLNPSEVESIEVLKDASATAIYGSRGANGVVLVTTKKGRTGRYSLTYNGLYGSTEVRRKLALMNAEQYATTVNANRAEFGLPVVFGNNDLTSFKNGVGTDWQDAIFRKGTSQNHTLSITGGNENTTYYVSGNLLKTKGIILASGYDRYSLRSNINSKINKRLSVGVNLFLGRELNHATPLNGFSNGSPVFSALLWAPTKTIYDTSGNYTLPSGNYGPPTNYNPVALAKEPVSDHYTNTTNIISNIDYTLLPGLKLNVSGGYKLLDFQNRDYVNSKATRQHGTESAGIFDSTLVSLQNTNMISYEKQIRDHKLKITGIMEQQYEQFNSNYAGSVGFLTDVLSYNNLGLGNNPQIPSSAARKRSLLSYMGRINYGYKDLYLLTLTARADASSVFGADNKWGYFPSVAVGWNIANENFMRDIRTFSSLKLRASYGIVGNQAILPYQSLASMNSSIPYSVDGSSLAPGVGLGGIANPNLKWEKTAQLNIGVDMQILEGRLDFVADYYNKKTSDLLLAVPTPAVAGGTGSVLENVGEVQNKGVEFYLGGKPVIGKFLWESGLTLTVNRNKVLALTGGQKEISLGSPGLPNFGNTIWMQVGQPLGLFRGLQMNGVWKSSEAAAAASFGTIPGAPKYVDQTKDGKITNDDKGNIGNAMPNYTFGWNNTFSFKGFDLNVFIQGSQGNKIYNISRVRFETTSSDADATSIRILNRWSASNENTDVPSFSGSAKSEDLQSSRWLEDGSYIRVKNIALGYTFPHLLVNALKISGARLYIGATNLLTFTKYSGFDPEASTSVDNFAGVDLATYPSQKSFTLGLNINF